MIQLLVFFGSFKSNLIVSGFFLGSAAIILDSETKVFLWISIALILFLLFLVYVKFLFQVFNKPSVYKIYQKIFSFVGSTISKSKIYLPDDEMKYVCTKDMNEKQLDKWKTNVQSLVLFNRVFQFLAKKMEIYQSSGFHFITSIYSSIKLLIFTIFSFSLINFGLYKIDSNFYKINFFPSIYNFFYSSFIRFFSSSPSDLFPLNPFSMFISMLESLFPWLLLAFVITFLIDVGNKKKDNELKETIENLKDQGTKIEKMIEENYQLNTIDEAMKILHELKSVSIDALYQLSKYL